MTICLAPLAAALLASAKAPPPLQWVRANLHAHSAGASLRDDGDEAPLKLHQALRARGVDFSLHSVHSSMNRGPRVQAAFRAQRQAEAALAVPGLTIAVGEELTVRDGPNYKRRLQLLGYEAPGNLNHLTILGARTFLPSEMELGAACDRVHRDGGLCIVNHPGPGPMMWEEGLWEAPGRRGKVDGLEVYNGQAMAAAGLDFERRYREATAYGGLGLRIAAVSGADTHGPDAVVLLRRRLAAGPGRLLALLGLPGPLGTTQRPELGAITLVRAAGPGEAAVIAALRARRSVATYGLQDVTLELPGLGEVRREGEVRLHLRLSRRVASITLYREGAPVRTWTAASDAEWSERIARPAAYVFAASDGAGRLLTSAIWYEPRP